jgi:XapX domain-containing protein
MPIATTSNNKEAGLSLLRGWIIGVVFTVTKLPAPVPPLIGLIGAAGVLLGGYCYEAIAKLLLKQYRGRRVRSQQLAHLELLHK